MRCNLHRASRIRRRGLTLVEILVATTVSLLLIFAVVSGFTVVSKAARDGRAIVETANRVRVCAARFQKDLEGLTVPVRAWASETSNSGYFELIEGDGDDIDPRIATRVPPPNDPAANNFVASMFGDIDDVVAFTSHGGDEPFYGRLDGAVHPSGFATTISALNAEIIWWTHWDDANGDGVIDQGELSIRRRALLVRPDIPRTSLPVVANQAQLLQFYNRNDLSVHVESGGQLVANSLADLTRRERRVAHDPTDQANMFRFDRTRLPELVDEPAVNVLRRGEDVMLSDAFAFDLKAFDYDAPVTQHPNPARTDFLLPDSPGYDTASQTTIGRGAYINLGYLNAASPNYSVDKLARWANNRTLPRNIIVAPAVTRAGFNTFDTWCFDYERDGIDQDGDGLVDEGTNGIDDDNANGVDDVRERETSPPYEAVLPGIQATFRTVELDTRQVRQISVATDFMPE